MRQAKILYNLNCFMVTLLLVAISVSACSGESGVDDSDRVPPIAALPDFPSIEETLFCGLRDSASELSGSLLKVEEGIASYKDLAEPLMKLVQGLDLARSLLDKSDLFTSDPGLADWINASEVPTITKWLRGEYLWFARKRVRLMDYNEYSLPELKTRAEKVVVFLDSYCEGRE